MTEASEVCGRRPAAIDTAMVFAAGLGTRMRPITDTLPKPLVRIGGRTMLDHMLDRLADAGVARAIVNVHHLAGQIETALAGRTRPQIVMSDERDRLLDQGGGIKKVLPLIGNRDFFICNTDAVWTEGPQSALASMMAAWRPADMDVLLLVASTAASVGVDWPGDFHMAPDGRLIKRGERDVAAFVYAGVGIIKSSLFAGAKEDVFRLAPYFFDAAQRRTPLRRATRRSMAACRNAIGDRRGRARLRAFGGVDDGAPAPVLDTCRRAIPAVLRARAARRRDRARRVARRRSVRARGHDDLCADAARGAGVARRIRFLRRGRGDAASEDPAARRRR